MSFQNGIETITHKFVFIIIEPIMWIFTGVSLIMFFWGLAVFILGEDDTAKSNGKKHLIWGLIGLFIIFAVNGIIAIIGSTIDGLI